MIPLRDINPTRNMPVVTYLLIAVNVAMFLYEVLLPAQRLETFIARYGMVPAYLTSGNLGSVGTLVTSMFLHGGWLHLIFNMWSLFIFGDNVEDRLGRVRYVLFYALTGFAAAFAQAAVDPDSRVPMVGASGAIAGVLAAYLRLYPGARVVTLIPVFFFFFVRELPAVLFIGLWFLLQLFGGLGSLQLGGQAGGGVAFFAHIGGFVAGLYLIGRLVPIGRPPSGHRPPAARRSPRPPTDYSPWQ